MENKKTYVEIMIDIKEQMSKKYNKNPKLWLQNMLELEKKYGIINGKPLKYPEKLLQE